MYPPKVHQEKDYSNALLTIKQFPLATLITPGDSPLVSHLPMIYSRDNKGNEKLVAHMDRYNPQCALLNGPGQAIFHGPEVYISPTIYTTPQFPTWNYLKVHLKGQMSILSKEDTKLSILEMIDKMEEKRIKKWTLAEDNPRLIKLLDFIVGFEFIIESWEGKFKISQDKIDADMSMAKESLVLATASIHHDYLNRIYSNHKNALKA